MAVHFRVLDLAAERCIWSVPPIDMVPLKLRGEELVVRSFDGNANLLEMEPVDGMKLECAIGRLLPIGGRFAYVSTLQRMTPMRGA